MAIDPLTPAVTFCSTLGAVIIATSWERVQRRRRNRGKRRGLIRRRIRSFLRTRSSSAASSVPSDPVVQRTGTSLVREHVYGPGFQAAWAQSSQHLPQPPRFQLSGEGREPLLRRAESIPPALHTIPEESIGRRRSDEPTSSTGDIPQGDGSQDRARHRKLDHLTGYEAVAEQLVGLERMILEDRIEALRWRIWQHRIDGMEERLVGLEHKAGREGAALGKSASIGRGSMTQRREDMMEELREAAVRELSALRRERTLDSRAATVEDVPA